MLPYALLATLFLPAAAAAAECPDYASEPDLLRGLEEYASRGALNAEEKACLEDNFARAREQTVKDKISRVLMVNAYATDTDDWAALVARHLEQVDRSDPDIAYLYAYFLYNRDPVGNAEEAIRWAEVGLERKDVWTGDVFVARVYGLHRLRTFAALRLWKDAVEAAAAGEGTEEAAELKRNEAKTYAREWVDMARSAGRDPRQAFETCLNVASEQACGAAAPAPPLEEAPKEAPAPEP